MLLFHIKNSWVDVTSFPLSNVWAKLIIILTQQAEAAIKQIENLGPPVVKQLLPLIQQLPPLYMDLVKGREDFIPKPEETRRLVCSHFSVIAFELFALHLG